MGIRTGQRYRHFKGGEYTVVMLGQNHERDICDGEVFVKGSRWVPIKVTAASDIPLNAFVVLYQGEDTRLWARNYANFTEILSSGPGDRASNYRRFELIEESE